MLPVVLALLSLSLSPTINALSISYVFEILQLNLNAYKTQTGHIKEVHTRKLAAMSAEVAPEVCCVCVCVYARECENKQIESCAALYTLTQSLTDYNHTTYYHISRRHI
jgi:hypothetical protein